MRLPSAGFSTNASISPRAWRRVSSSSDLTQPSTAWLIASRNAFMAAPLLRGSHSADSGPSSFPCPLSGPSSARQLEVGDRAAQVGGQLREVSDRLGGLSGTKRGLARNLAYHAHGPGDVGRRDGLLLGGHRNALDEFVQCVGHALDLGQRGTGILGQARTGDYFGSGLFHRADRLVGIGLNGLDQAF